MVKTVYSLALRALTVNQQMSVHLMRIQHGFLPGKNIEEARYTIHTMQEMLTEMQKALEARPEQSKNYVPLK
jgi:NifU-like protein involved in Fe-S cluster formation